jgi:Ion channel
MAPSSSQEIAVVLPLLISLATTLATIVVHVGATAAIAYFLLGEYRRGRAGVRFWRDVAIIAGGSLLALAAHLAEITIWALALDSSGQFTHFATAFYHSAMNYSSLGYGDIVMSNSWKLMGPLEAANGMLMFGISTAMIFAVMQLLFQTRVAAVADLRVEFSRDRRPSDIAGQATP